MDERAVLITWFVTAAVGMTASPPKFTTPPGGETPMVRERIDAAEQALRSGRSASDVLGDADLVSLHEWPRFRSAIRQYATASRTTLVSAGEPGAPLVVIGRVLERGGHPARGLKVYAYQTSSRGWYSDRAAHISGMEGDRKHARLFGYITTDDAGKFELRTIRPAGYPESDLPAHIHLEVSATDGPGLITEVQFEDDPRLTSRMRDRSRGERFIIAPVLKGPDESQRVEVELRLP
jgi:hypothetical protein